MITPDKNLLNYSQQNEEMRKAITSSVEAMFPIVNGNKRLELQSISVDDNIDDFDFPRQKEIKMTRSTWEVPIYAKLAIVDSVTGKTIDKAEKIKIGSIPKITPRFSVIIEGNEYSTVNQIRRKSGVYSRLKKNGELESEFNLSRGKNFKMELDPTTQVFYMILDNRRYRLWTILNLLGTTETELKKVWGSELLDINKKGALNNEESELDSLYRKFVNKAGSSDPMTVRSGLVDYFTRTELDPDTTKITLGESYSSVSGGTLVAAANKLLKINKGESEPDDRDSLVFKKIYSPDDLLSVYFEKQAPILKKKLERTLGLKEKVRETISSATFGGPVKRFFTVGDLASTPPQTNPATMIAEWRKTSPMGTGGIESSHAITNDTRAVQATHLGFLDPLATPDGGKVGITVGLASEVQKVGNEMATPLIDIKAGKIVWMNPAQFFNHKIGFPDQYKLRKENELLGDPISDTVVVMYNGKTQEMPASEVEYYLRSPKTMFSLQQNLVPFLQNVQGNRASMSSRYITQALSLKDREAPLVQTYRGVKANGDVKTYQQLIGRAFTPITPISGRVTKITPDYVYVTPASGETQKVGLYKDFPLNQDGYLDSTVTVALGDEVKKGQTVAEINYTRGETLALGRNMDVALMSYKGYNFEDGIVISEGAAKKMSHEMIHQENVFYNPKLSVLDKVKFNAWFPDVLTQDNFNKLDDRGIIKVGATINPGDAIVAILVEKQLDDLDQALKKLDKITFSNYSKYITKWDNEDSGVVTDVRINGRNIDIYVKAEHPMRVGDKLSGSYGNKGIITKIVPDGEMPFSKATGKPMEVLMSPQGVPNRMNIGQILETSASKIAAKTGKPYIMDNFHDSSIDWSKKVGQELKDNGLTADEILIDGETGKEIKTPIFTGKQYMYKLRHLIDKKMAAHDYGAYDINEQPAGKGAQKIGQMETYAYLAHSAKSLLRDATTIKSRKNEDYWRDLQLGLPPRNPAKNFVFEKLTTYLKGAGVNVKKEGNSFRIMPLTDADVMEMSSGEITDPGALLVGKNLATRKNGLFDPAITGGLRGTNWGHINLAYQMPNPMYEDAIRKSLDLTQEAYDKVLQGKSELGGLTGAPAIIKALDFDVNAKLTALKAELKTAPPTNVNKLNTKIKFLEALKDLKYSPVDAYTMKKVPIIPPAFRPIYALPSGDLMVSDINKHYRDLGLINKGLNTIGKDLTPEELIKDQYTLYSTIKGLQGLSDPLTYSDDKYKGFLKEIGKTKTGLVHGTAWSKRQDLSGRSTITVDSTLGLDEMGLPKEIAYKIYKPFIVRELKEFGLKATEALREYQDETPLALQTLSNIMKTRPVILNRAPSLHKHSVQAFTPILTDGKDMKLNPLINKAFSSDFDGDQQTGTVLVWIPDSVIEENNTKKFNSTIDIDINNDYICNIEDGLLFKNTNIKDTIKMSARFNVSLPTKEVGGLYIKNLEDFPHNENESKEQGHITFYTVPEGIKVFAYNEKTNSAVLANVSGWSIHKDREVWTVTLNNGAQIITDDDPRAVYGLLPDSLEFGRRTPSGSVGMRVPVLKDTSKVKLAGWTLNEIPGIKDSKIKDTIKLNKETGWLMGALIGDGWVDIIDGKHKAVNLAAVEMPIVEQYKKVLTNEVFIDSPHVGHQVSLKSYGKSEKWIVSSSDYAKWTLPLIGKGAANKHLPTFWFNTSKEFRLGLLSGLIDTDGSMNISNGKTRPQLMINYSSINLRLMQEVQQLCRSLGIRSKISFSKKTSVGNDFWMLYISSVDIVKLRDNLFTVHAKNREALYSEEALPSENSGSSTKTDMVPITKEIAEYLAKLTGGYRIEADRANKSDYTALRKSIASGVITRFSAKKIISKYSPDTVKLASWLKIVENETVTWTTVKEVENTGKKETGYDLTVPGFETFMNLDGVILSNTMSVMVPVSQDAVLEAYKMFPSVALYKHGDNQLMPELSKDYVYGLWALSKIEGDSGKTFKTLDEAKKAIDWNMTATINGKRTTVGQLLINDPLPVAYRDYTREMNNKAIEKILNQLGKEAPGIFSTVINRWKDLAASYSYMYGHTISLNDFNTNKSFRDDVLKDAMKGISKKTDAEKVNIYMEATKKIQANQAKALKGTNLGHMLDSGSIKSADSIRQISSLPGVLVDLNGNPIAVPVLKSYGEGIDTPSYFNSLYAVRKGTVDRSVNTQDSGALNKSLLSVTRSLLVTKADCGTEKGLSIPIDSKNVMDRALLETIKGVGRRNDIIGSEIILKAKKAGLSELPVRSPLTCEAVEGICQLCYGLMPNGQLPAIGTNVGIADGQALSERSCNHAKSLIIVKSNENIEVITLEELFAKYLGKLPVAIGGEDSDTEILDLSNLNILIFDGNAFVKLNKIGRHIPTAEMVLIKTKDQFSTVCQANHPLPVYESLNKCSYCRAELYTSALNLNSVGTLKCHNCGKRKNNKFNPELSSKTYTKKTSESMIVRSDRLKQNASIFKELRDPGKYKELPLTDYWIGFYLAEGCIVYGRSRKHEPIIKGISISQIPSVWMEKLAIENPQYTWKITGSASETAKAYRTNSIKLGTEFEHLFGRYSHNKHLPNDFINYEEDKLLKILSGLIDGDGFISTQTSTVHISTNSFYLLQQLQIIGTLLGVRTTTCTDHDNGMMGHQGQKVEFQFTDHYLTELAKYSHKVKDSLAKLRRYEPVTTNEFSKVQLIRKFKYAEKYVYDVETETHVAQIGLLQSHNTQLTMKCAKRDGKLKYQLDSIESECTHEDLWNMFDSEISIIGGVESKEAPKNLKLWSGSGWVKVKKLQRHHPEVPMVFLKLKDGNAIITQEDHPLLIFKKHNECKCHTPKLKFIAQGKAKCDTCKRVTDVIEDFTNYRKDYLTTLNIKKEGFLVDYTSYLGKTGTLKDPDFNGYFTGFYAGDGNIQKMKDGSKYWGIMIAQSQNTPAKIRDEFLSHAKQYFPTINNSRETGLSLYSVSKAKYMESIVRSKATEKQLEGEYYKYSKEWLTGFLAGLIDADGTVMTTAKSSGSETSRIKIYSSSWALVQQIFIIARILEIKCSLNIAKFRISSKDRSPQNQPYSATLTLPDNKKGILDASVKVRNKYKKYTTFNKYFADKYISEVISHSAVHETGYTYDFPVEGEKYLVNGILYSNTFHSSGSALVKSGITEGFPRIEQLLKVPEKLSGKATLSTETGIVDRVTENAIGGHDVWINAKKHVVMPGLELLVKPGQKVQTGDRLSSGNIKPQELGALKSHLAAQQYIVDELNEIYENKFYKKSFETVVRAVSDNAEITEAPEDSGFIRGDTTSLSAVTALNKSRKKQGLPELGFISYFKSIDTQNTESPDWLTKLTTNRAKAALMTGAPKGEYANIKGKDPIPAYIYGDQFGEDFDPDKGQFY